MAVAVVVGVVNIALLYRRIGSIGTLTVSLWIGTLLTTAAVIVTGAMHFDPALAFDVPPGAFSFSVGFLFGLGAASRVGIYDYLGYYNVAYIGDEVTEPGRVIPRSILISVVAVAVIYIGDQPVDSRRRAVAGVRAGGRTSRSRTSSSRCSWSASTGRGWRRCSPPSCSGRRSAPCSRCCWATRGFRTRRRSTGPSSRSFARLHPTKRFPHVSLVLIGVVAIAASTLSLGMVIDALITTRILVQFIGQIVALTLLRRHAPDMPRPFRMWLYPLPNLVALFGWIFLFATSGTEVIAFGLGTLALGVAAFFAWSR